MPGVRAQQACLCACRHLVCRSFWVLQRNVPGRAPAPPLAQPHGQPSTQLWPCPPRAPSRQRTRQVNTAPGEAGDPAPARRVCEHRHCAFYPSASEGDGGRAARQAELPPVALPAGLALCPGGLSTPGPGLAWVLAPGRPALCQERALTPASPAAPRQQPRAGGSPVCCSCWAQASAQRPSEWGPGSLPFAQAPPVRPHPYPPRAQAARLSLPLTRGWGADRPPSPLEVMTARREGRALPTAQGRKASPAGPWRRADSPRASVASHLWACAGHAQACAHAGRDGG